VDRLSPTSSLVALVALGALGTSGCRARTEIVVVVASDLDIPMELTRVQIEGRDPASGVTIFGAFDENVDPSYEASSALPLSLSITNRSQAERPFVTYVRAYGRDGFLAEQAIETSFVTDASRLLCFRLERACIGVECGGGSTCVRGACVPASVASALLPPVTASSLAGVTCERSTLEEPQP
jgi:hypothetical protein